MTIKEAPNLDSGLIHPLENIRDGSKQYFGMLAIELKNIFMYFWLLFTPLIVFFIVFKVDIFSYVFDIVEKDKYSSAIIIFTTGFSLGCWLYKSALFADQDNNKKSKIILDNSISLLILVFLIYDFSTDFIVFNSSMGLKLEQYYMMKSFIIIMVAVDFWLGLLAGIRFYKENNLISDNVNNLSENINNDNKVEVNDSDAQLDEEDYTDDQDKDRFWKKVALFTGIAMLIGLAIFVMLGNSGFH